MNERKMIYKPKPIEVEPLSREILVHGAMHYKCECCGELFKMWLEKGLEDRMQDKIKPDAHKPVPFCISCTCGGTAKHILWQSDIRLNDYRLLEEDESYFENVDCEDCGKPHLRSSAFDELEKKAFGTPAQHLKELEELMEKDDDDASPVALGLENYSMSQLKAEIRRRKRW